MTDKKKRIIKSGNPHWCVSYLKHVKQDNDVDALIKIIMKGKSASALFDFSRLRVIDPRFHHLTRSDFLKKLKSLGVKSMALHTV